ncbi:NrsF family protein [Orrella daihaiensis]|uniref:DUF1109 domain-containing protein n=1 Tax=Orrella daihaiensis TaxID=2782176 RepID=A0ABY4AIC0_9BURK|nr:DUF1109 domain-containing protein [Orrella daihaiensis]UOD50038.1 DUF1109 domain-containing protein [Orrella daihaiensis]
MKTSHLIRLLATNAEPVDVQAVAKALTWPIAIGLTISASLSVTMMGFLPSHDFLLPVIWAKFIYGLTLAFTLVFLLDRLYRPGVAVKAVVRWPLATLFCMAGIGFVYLMVTPESLRVQAIFGQTWLVCPWFVLGLSIPGLALLLYAARALAPTDLKATGFAAGLLAGAIGALGYSFACPETSLTFIAIWYTTGIVLAGLVGRIVGPVVLRW